MNQKNADAPLINNYTAILMSEYFLKIMLCNALPRNSDCVSIILLNITKMYKNATNCIRIQAGTKIAVFNVFQNFVSLRGYRKNQTYAHTK